MHQIQPEARDPLRLWLALAAEDQIAFSIYPNDAIQAHPDLTAEALPSLLKYIDSPDQTIRRHMVSLVSALGPKGKAAFPALLQAAKTQKDPELAIRSLGKLKGEAKSAVPLIVENWGVHKKIGSPNDPRPRTFLPNRYLEALADIGPDASAAVPTLVRSLSDPEVIRTLGYIGAREASPPLEKLYPDSRGLIRVWTAFALARITGKSEPYAEDLIKIVTESNRHETREQATQALKELGLAVRPVLGKLISLLENERVYYKREGESRIDEHLVKNLVLALRQFGPDAAPAMPRLVELYGEKDTIFRKELIDCFAAIGPVAKQAVPLLEKEDSEEKASRRALLSIQGKK
jgi:HEAT repeat protein